MKTILGLLLLCSSVMSSASGQEKKDTLRVLFVGNSYIYYNNLAQLTMVLTDSTDTKLICTKSTLGGGTLGSQIAFQTEKASMSGSFRHAARRARHSDHIGCGFGPGGPRLRPVRGSVAAVAGASPDESARRPEPVDVSTRRRLVVRSIGASLAWVAAIVTAYYLLPWNGGGAAAVALRVVLAVVLVIAVSVASVRSVLHDPFPVLRAIQALGLVVALALVSFASIYLLMSSNDAAAFSEPPGLMC